MEKRNCTEFSFSVPTKVFLGAGQLSRIGEEAKKMGSRALLVTGRSAMRGLGITDRVKAYLGSSNVHVDLFDRVIPNPTVETIDQGGELAKRKDCDLIIGLGGGSVIDAAKGIAIVARHGGRVEDYIGLDKIPGPALPVVAVPTTSGTGSEVTVYAVFTKGTSKGSVNSCFNYPKVSIVDPVLLVSQPSQLTACTGMDALAHAVEAYTSRRANPFSDVLAREAIRLVGGHLRRAVWVGDDLDARMGMALASNLAGMAINYAGTTAGHALGMSIGGFFGTEHGTTVGILLPCLMRYVMSADLERFAEISVLLGEKTGRISVRNAAMKSIQAVTDLMTDVNMSLELSEIGVKADLIPSIVKDAMNTGAFRNTLRSLSKEEVKELVHSALSRGQPQKGQM